MSRRFTRNIKDTDFKKEPLYTNQQNDLLSDGTDVAVRNNDEYHLLTDNIKTITSANTGLLRVQSTGKNSRKLVPNDKILTKDDPELDKFAKKSDLDVYAEISESHFEDGWGGVIFSNGLQITWSHHHVNKGANNYISLPKNFKTKPILSITPRLKAVVWYTDLNTKDANVQTSQDTDISIIAIGEAEDIEVR